MSSGGGGAVTMLQITEDTPPDMLAGAMDLTVHLPTGRAVKMAVERSTPMMDLLVQITTNHHLQLSNYTLQALGMAPSSEHSDRILPYKPNTPIGTLDTQHIKVVPKSRTLPSLKNIPPGHQPFESTFRLKVHLPRNQLYVTRVSRHVLLEDIIKKVCEEKNLDPSKYELKHPGNLDEVLDPKLTLSDYQITEIYVVLKGTVNLNQAFSSNDIMALRKEEERKQMHNKTGGGVFNLIFRRGKSNMGSGSISSDTRSISPTHSDDSRSVTPPAIPQQILTPPPKKDAPQDRPKPPQRKRRPAPKPPQTIEEPRRNSEEKPPSNVSLVTELQARKGENGLTICHSRNSSDSSGYHEASVLSDNCNTSLPRRPKSAFVTNGDIENISKMHSQSTTNLSKMSYHSKSTTSLGIAGRKKKAAPPPPPVVRASNPTINVETPSPVVASQPANTQQELHPQGELVIAPLSAVPVPRNRQSLASKEAPIPPPRKSLEKLSRPTSLISANSIDLDEIAIIAPENPKVVKKTEATKIDNNCVVEEIIKEQLEAALCNNSNDANREELSSEQTPTDNNDSQPELKLKKDLQTVVEVAEPKVLIPIVSQLQKQTHENIFSSPEFLRENKPEITDAIPKTLNEQNVVLRSETFSINSRPSTTSYPEGFSTTRSSVTSAVDSFTYFTDEYSDVEDLNSGSSVKKRQSGDFIHNQVYRAFDRDTIKFERTESVSSLRSLQSLPGFFGGNGSLKKWNNFEDLDDLSLTSLGPNNPSVAGDHSEPESFSSQLALDSLASITSGTSNIAEVKKESKFFGSTDSGIAQETAEKLSEFEEIRTVTPPPPPILEDQLPDTIIPPPPLEESEVYTATQETVHFTEGTVCAEKEATAVIEEPLESTVSVSAEHINSLEEKPSKVNEERLIEPNRTPNEDNIKESDVSEIDWQYQLPSPPKAFRDSSPLPESVHSDLQSVDCKDSVVTSPELFEKLKVIEDNQSDKATVVSDLSSTVSEEERPLCNNLSLEKLEKRKSLVYNREISTSLKMTDNDAIQLKDENIETFSSSLTKFESTFVDLQKSSQIVQTNEPKYIQRPITTHTLPNFKISTYDKPKQKIKVFEDDTIHSNTENFTKVSRSIQQTINSPSTLTRSYVGRSMENISFRKSSYDDQYKPTFEEKEYDISPAETTPILNTFGPMSSIFRSESFSTDTHWSPSRPVSRSKSHLTLNAIKYKESKAIDSEENISRSNSLYDVSGLQSLGVMRLIQNKLNTPTSSMENVYQPDRFQKSFIKTEPPKEKPLPPRPPIEETPKVPEKVYRYRGPPSVNMGTWSERPKIPVSVKEDADYKLSNPVSSKLIVNTTNNNITSNNTIEVTGGNSISNTKVNGFDNRNSGVSIQVKGKDSVDGHEKSGNVIIKIGSLASEKPRIIDNQRFINHTTASGYRKPLSNIHNYQATQRPHSVAFGSDFDISRIPVVRSVELKKPYKDMGNTTITQIYQGDSYNTSKSDRPEPVSESKYFSISENGNGNSNLNQEPKNVFRVKSFKPVGSAPVVRGFKSSNDSSSVNKYSWNPPKTFNTLPGKSIERESYQTNAHVPFSQSNLRRTASNINTEKNSVYVSSEPDTPINSLPETASFSSLPSISKTEIKPPAPPPMMPSVTLKKPTCRPAVDQRDQLLSAIRNFGGKKGLKSVKV